MSLGGWMSDPIPFTPEAGVERKERARAAQDLLDNKAFTAAILALRKQWFAEWVASKDLSEDLILKAKIQALEAIPQQLTILVNDEKMAQAKKK